MRIFAALLSLCFIFSAEAHQGRPRGRNHTHNHHHQQRDCQNTFVARTQSELADYESLRTQSGVDRNLHINTDITATDLRIATDCEIKIKSHVKINVTHVVALFAEKIDFGNKAEILSADLYVKTAKKIKLDDHLEITAQRMLIESDEEIKFKNKSILTADIGIFNAPDCDVKPHATRLVTQELGTCFNKAPFYLKLEVAPASGDAPLNVVFDASKSFGLLDKFVYHFGTTDTLETTSEGAAYTYVTPGSFSSRLEVKGSFGSLYSPVQIIEVNAPPVVNAEIHHEVLRVNPPGVIFSTKEVPAIENLKEFLWDYGDGSNIVVPYALSAVGFMYHDYAVEDDYTVRLRLKNQANVVTPPIQKVISTFIDSLPSPRYSISSFKGEAPFTVDIQALETVDDAGQPLRYKWFFSDTMETISSGPTRQVQHTFTQPGIYQVQLNVMDSLNGSRTTIIPIYVGQANALASLPPIALIDSTDRFGEAPLNVGLSAARSFDPDGMPGQTMTYRWSFFDYGRNQNVVFLGQNLSYTFIKPGSIQVVLTVTDVTGQQTVTSVPVFVSGIAPTPGGFNVLTTGTPMRYGFNVNAFLLENSYSFESLQWDFGDGTYATVPNVDHTFPAPGSYNITLRIRKPEGAYETYTQALQVTATPAPQTASFTTNGNRYNLGEAKTFTAITSNPADVATTHFTWHFGDGQSVRGIGTSFSTVSHIYAAPGSYRVTLHAQFATGLANFFQIFLTPNTPPVLGVLKIYGLPASAPSRLGFAPHETATDSDGFIQTYVYEFGDGSAPITSTQGYLEHTYEAAGTYSVKITAIDNNGGRTSRTTGITLAANQAPIASIKLYLPPNLTAPIRIGFAAYEQSIDADGFINQYEYDFGDGEIVTTQEGYLEHDYNTAGSYRLGLRVRDDKGLWSEKVFYDLVVLANQAPIARMSVDVFDATAPGRVGVEVWRTSSDSDGYITEYEYDFGDGTILLDNDGYEQHSYTSAGSYTIKVRVKDDKGLWSLPVEQSVTIAPNQRPIAINTIYNNDYIAPTKLGMNAGVSSFDPDGYLSLIEYDFGDGTYITRSTAESYIEHEYTVPGPYIVRVRVSDNDGLWSEYASASIEIKSNQPPIARLRLEKDGTELPITVTALAWDSTDADGFIPKFIYDLGDGNFIESNSGSKTFSFNSHGTKTVGLRVQDNKGTLSARVEAQIELVANQAPIVNFTATVFDSVAPGRVGIEAYQLSSDSDGYLTQFEYDLGDGTFLTTSDGYVEHEYIEAGTYSIRVRVRDDKQLWSEYAVKEVLIRSNQAPIVITNFFQFSQYAPTNIQVNAWDTIDTDGFIAEFRFDFGDGTLVSSTQAYQQHTYTLPGLYLVKVEALDNKGASGFASFQIEVKQNASPVAQLNLNPGEPFFVGREITASAFGSIDPDGAIVDYQIDWGDGARSSGVEVKHTYAAAGLYDVRLTLRDDFGNSSELVRTIDVNENSPPIAEIQVSPDVLKQYEIITFEATNAVDPEGHLISYSWEFSDGEKDYGKKVPKFFKEPGQFSAKLILIDQYGAKTELTQILEVEESDISLPTPVIAVNDTDGKNYHLVVADGKRSSSILSAIASYEWDWGDESPLESGVEVSHSYAESGEYTIRLKVTDTEGNTNTTFKVIQYEDINYDYEPISDATLLVAGLDVKGFNPRNARVDLSLEGLELAGGLTSVQINDVEVSLIENNPTRISFNANWLDDRNELKIETYDENGGKVAKEFVIYAGSRTIQFELSNVTPDTVLRLHHTENKEIFEEVRTSQNGVVSITNVPAKPTFVFSSNPQGQIAHDLLSGSENALIIPMEDFAAPAPANFDLANGAAGWVSSQGSVAVVGSEQNKFAEISLTSGREVILSHTAQPNFDKPFVVSKREYRSANPNAVVLTLLRNSSGRVEYSFARMDEGLFKGGEYYLTPDPLSMVAVQDTTLETRLALYSLENSTVKKNPFLDTLYAHAQTTTGVSGQIQTGPSSVTVEGFKLKAINWESGLKDSSKKLSNRDACGIGFGPNTPGAFDSNDPRFSFSVASALTQELEIVGVVGFWARGEGASIGGVKVLMTAEDSRIGLQDSRCYIGQSSAGSSAKRICNVGVTYEQPITTAMTQANPGNFKVAYLDQMMFQGERISLKLVVMAKEKFEELGGESKRLVILNNYQQIVNSADVQAVNSQTNCYASRDKNNYPVFYKVDQFVTRKTSRDAVDIGGDDWAQSHVLLAAQGMPGINFNDFSTQYGGKFYPHETHQNGLDADFTTEEYAKLENKSYRYLGDGLVEGTQTCSTNIKTKIVAKKITYSFLDSIKDDFARSYRDINQVAGTFFLQNVILSEQKTNVECPKGKVDDPTEYKSNFTVGTLLLADKQILRSDSTSQVDLNFLKDRTCLGKRTMNSILDSGSESVAGHTDHWHIDWHSYERRLPDEYPFDSEKYETKAEVEYDGDQASLMLTIPHVQNSNVYVDIYFLDSEGGENRLFQYDATEEVRLATCHDPRLKISSGVYERDIRWCNEGWDFLPTPTVSGRTLTFEMPKALLQQNVRKLEDLRVRYVTVLENSSNGYCKEEEGFLVDPVTSCADGSADPGPGELHPNGGGFVAYNAYVHPGAFVGESSRVCSGARIESAEVELLGNTIVSGNTTVSGCVTTSSNGQGDVIIKGFGSGVKILNDCSRGNNFRTLISGPSLIEGEVEIVSPTFLFNIANIVGHSEGTTGSSKVIIDGACNYRGQLATNGVVSSGTPEHHIQGPVHISNCISSYSSRLKGLRSVGLTGIGSLFVPIQINYSVIEDDVYLESVVGIDSAIVKSSNLIGGRSIFGEGSGISGSQSGEYNSLPFFKTEDSEFRGNFNLRGANVKNSNFDCFPFVGNSQCIIRLDPALNLTIENMSVLGASYICDQTTGSFDNEYACNGIRKPLTGYQQ